MAYTRVLPGRAFAPASSSLLLRAAILAGLIVVPQSAKAQTSLADVISGCGGVAPQTTILADASNYQARLGLAPGERLLLAAGTYPNGLPVSNIHGAPNQCIVIEGPATGPPAVFTGRSCCNTVSIRNSSYVIIRNLEIDGSAGIGDAVKAESDSTSSHHLMLENLNIHDHDADQQIVGINTKSIVWNWVIRNNVIDGAGTGIYLGDSDGEAEFVNGLIEYNLIQNTLGYNMQVKHQNGRATGLGAPVNGTTIIRHNVFSKAQGSSTINPRPNLLVGHWPLSGAGMNDVYQIYGNLFYQNPVEALLQGEGNIAIHDNLMVNDFAPSGFSAVAILPHNDVPKAVEIFHNTVVAAGTGIVATGGDTNFQQRVRANAVFSPSAISAPAASDNITATYAMADNFVVNPTAPIGAGLDLYPLPGTLTDTVVDLSDVAGFVDSDRDFNGTLRGGTFRGAYAGDGANPGWLLALERKTDVGSLAADLAITKSNNQLISVPGATTTFAIEVTNNGPEDVTASVVTDNFDPAVYDVVNVSWTCATGAGSGPGTSCPPSGTGADLVAGVDVNVESGDTVSFSVDAPVLQAAAGLLSNTATVDPPAGVTDPALGNNSATDIDGVPGACGFANDLDLSNQVIDTVEIFTVCNSIAAGAQFEVPSPGDLTFRAGVVVVLRNGFSVQSGARFTAVLDASLAPP